MNAMTAEERDIKWLDRWEWTDNLLGNNADADFLNAFEFWQDSDIASAKICLLKVKEASNSTQVIKFIEEMITLLK